MYSLIKNNNKDQIDSIAIPTAFLKAAPDFAKKWRPVHAFKGKGSLTVTVSSDLDGTIIDSLKMLFLKNNEISIRTWQNKGGLGEFVESR